MTFDLGIWPVTEMYQEGFPSAPSPCLIAFGVELAKQSFWKRFFVLSWPQMTFDLDLQCILPWGLS